MCFDLKQLVNFSLGAKLYFFRRGCKLPHAPSLKNAAT